MLQKLYNAFRMKKAAQEPLEESEQFLTEITGIMHVGAHRGPERHTYGSLNLDVLWVEADPDTFKVLNQNIAQYPRQIAVNALVSDTDNEEIKFHVASNNGASSSMFAFAKHAEQFPHVVTSKQITLRTSTVAKLVKDHNLDMKKYKALILDVQGAELNVLKGLGDTLSSFKWLKIEASDYEAYKGGAVLQDIVDFCTANGFTEHGRYAFLKDENIGNYYDVVFKRNES